MLDGFLSFKERMSDLATAQIWDQSNYEKNMGLRTHNCVSVVRVLFQIVLLVFWGSMNECIVTQFITEQFDHFCEFTGLHQLWSLMGFRMGASKCEA